MRKKELMEKTNEELMVERSKLKKEMQDMKFKKVTGVLENPLKIKVVRRNIARINTIIHMNELKKLGVE